MPGTIDWISRFAGIPIFVYAHIVCFGLWIGLIGFKFRWDDPPFDWLAIIVSLEAIFPSACVLISQDRADIKRQIMANEHWDMVDETRAQNKQLLEVVSQILELTEAASAQSRRTGSTNPGDANPPP